MATVAAAPDPEPQGWGSKGPMILGLLALIVLVGGFGTWAVRANIAGAIISSGSVAVEDNRQVVQHPDGGVVVDVLVREGDSVEAGEPLLRLDRSTLASEAQILRDRLGEVTARIARLVAERDGAEEIAFPQALLDAAGDDPEIAEVVEGQRNLFVTRLRAEEGAVEQLRRRQEQIRSQIEGISAQRSALDTQLVFIDEELTTQRDLLSRGLAQAPRVLSLQREEARLLGQAGELDATAAELEGRITEIDLQVLNLDTERQEESIALLRDLRLNAVELTEQLRAVEEQLGRLEIDAPVGGIVHAMKVYGQRAVVRPAEPLLYIVPQDRPLVIQARVDPLHIDQVFPGQPVVLRLPSFDARTTPEIFGKVVQVSPDSFTDDATGMSYYQAEILPDEGEVERLGEVDLLPGMPVEAFLRTDDRSPLAYLVKPLTDYFTRAFREG
jgi:HlyD family secretion protein